MDLDLLKNSAAPEARTKWTRAVGAAGTLLETDTDHPADHVFVMVRRAQRGIFLRLPTVLSVTVPPNAAKKTTTAAAVATAPSTTTSTTSDAGEIAADAAADASLPSDAGASSSASASASASKPPVFQGSCAKCGKHPLTELAWLCLHWYVRETPETERGKRGEGKLREEGGGACEARRLMRTDGFDVYAVGHSPCTSEGTRVLFCDDCMYDDVTHACDHMFARLRFPTEVEPPVAPHLGTTRGARRPPTRAHAILMRFRRVCLELV